MRLRSMLALCAATATAVSVLGVPAGAQESSPKAAAHKAAKSDVRDDGATTLSLGSHQLKQFQGYPTVVAIVGYDDPTEQVQQYAPYTLTANGATQAGG